MAAALVGFDDCVTDARLEAFTRFVDARREKAIRIAWRLTAGTGTGDHALAEDAAQDALPRPGSISRRILPGERAAIRAVERWKYRPEIQGGEPTARRGIQTVLRFELDPQTDRKR